MWCAFTEGDSCHLPPKIRDNNVSPSHNCSLFWLQHFSAQNPALIRIDGGFIFASGHWELSRLLFLAS